MATPPAGFVSTTVPGRIADLGLGFVRPADWVLPALPEETPDFTQPQTFVALTLAMAPFAAVVFAVGARPAYEDGSLAEWLAWLLRDQGYDPGPVEAEPGLAVPAVGCWAMQQSGDTVMRMRLCLFEDGGRLVQVTAMAPQALWSAVHGPLHTMLHSLELANPRGSRAALAPAGTELPASTFGPMLAVVTPAAPVAVVAPEPETAAEPDAVEPEADAVAEVLPAVEVATESATAPDDEARVESFASDAVAYAELARGADLGTLREDHPLNQTLLQNGAGFPLRILRDHGPAQAGATVLAPALQAVLRLPYGWHGLDDSRRTLVHDGAGGVQIAAQRRAHDGRSAHAFLRDALTGLEAEQPGLTGRRLRSNGVEMLLVQGLVVDGEAVAQAWFLKPAPGAQFLVLRCTCRPGDLARTGNLAELLVRDVVFLDDPVEGPAWWQEAVRLERLERLEEAEQCLLRHVQHLGAYSQVAHLHELRGNRLLALGDRDGATAAYERSGEWMDSMAAGATSGGEGAALSLQRDEHRARLGLTPFPRGG
jgi:hypothetical protein